MKSILMIGMGRFGRHLCKNLADLGNQIMIVDQEEENLQELLPYVVSAKIGDCTNPTVLKSLGVQNFDMVFVCIGTNFQSSLEITSQVKELGAKVVVSKASRDIHAKFLLRNGADEVIYPDRDIAEKAAVRYSSDQVFDYVELTEEYSIFEITPLSAWVGRTLKESAIRNRHGINVIGIKQGGAMKVMPSADYVVREDDHLMVIGRKSDIEKLLSFRPEENRN